jgi:hypothetical protein
VERVGEGWRGLEKVGEGWRRLEKVGEKVYSFSFCFSFCFSFFINLTIRNFRKKYIPTRF